MCWRSEHANLITGDYTSPPTSFPRASQVSHQHAYTIAWCHVIASDYQGGTKLLPPPKGIMPKGKVTTFGNFRKHKRIRGHIQPSQGRYCEKLPKTKEKQKWQLHTIKFSPNAHSNSFALFQDSHRLTFDPGGHTFTKQEATIRDQVCKFEDRSSQEGGDDGHHPATTIPLRSKSIGFEEKSFSRGRGWWKRAKHNLPWKARAKSRASKTS